MKYFSLEYGPILLVFSSNYDFGQYQQFMHSPSEEHKNVVIRILRYSEEVIFRKGNFIQKRKFWIVTATQMLIGQDHFKIDTLQLATSRLHKRNLVTWRSNEQEGVARYKAEAEHRGMAKINMQIVLDQKSDARFTY